MPTQAWTLRAAKLLIAGGMCLAIASLNQPFREGQVGWLEMTPVFVLPGNAPIALASLALAWAYSAQAGGLGRVALATTGVGALICLAGFLGWNSHFSIPVGVGLHGGGALLLALAQMHRQSLPVPA